MTRVVRLAKLEMLRRRLSLARDSLEEIERSKVLARRQAEEPERWNQLYLALRATRLPSNPGSIVGVLIALNGAFGEDLNGRTADLAAPAPQRPGSL